MIFVSWFVGRQTYVRFVILILQWDIVYGKSKPQIYWKILSKNFNLQVKQAIYLNFELSLSNWSIFKNNFFAFRTDTQKLEFYCIFHWGKSAVLHLVKTYCWILQHLKTLPIVHVLDFHNQFFLSFF